MSKVGRNDPCSCGSGKKYKKCCGKAKSKGLSPERVSVSSTNMNRASSSLNAFFQKKLEGIAQEATEK